MYRIGEFSSLGKVTVKALRYYEKEKILIPSFVDEETGYRFYETNQLIDLSRIILFRQIGFSIDDIKSVLNGKDLKVLLAIRKAELQSEISISEDQLSRINNLLIREEKGIMNYEAVIKELPECIVFYREGIIDNFSQISSFIIEAGEECRNANPDIKCIEAEYCFMRYLDGEYKDKDIKVEYAQAVDRMGNETKNTKFKSLESINAVCIYHKGAYTNIGEAYGFIMKWIEDNNYEIVEFPRERYIDGMWNKEKDEDWLTEIQVPVKKK